MVGDPLSQSLSQMFHSVPVCQFVPLSGIKYTSWWFQSLGRVLVKLDHVSKQIALNIEDPFFNQQPTLDMDF